MQIWQEIKGWKYYSFDLDEELSVFTRFQPLYDLWREKKANKFLPAWKDFAFEEFKGWHPNITLFEVRHDPFDLYYRIFGSVVSDTYGENFSGETLLTANQEIEDEYDLWHFEQLYKQQKYGASEGPVHWSNQEYIKLKFFDLPLSDDGKDITHFLTATIREEAPLPNY